jgi:hypothetical protein
MCMDIRFSPYTILVLALLTNLYPLILQQTAPLMIGVSACYMRSALVIAELLSKLTDASHWDKVCWLRVALQRDPLEISSSIGNCHGPSVSSISRFCRDPHLPDSQLATFGTHGPLCREAAAGVHA